MSDSSPEDFMEQALKIITELKKALEASFEERDKRINGLFSAQDTRIDDIKDVLQVLVESFSNQKNSIAAISTKYDSLNTKFEQHKNNHVSQSSVDSAINELISSHSRQHNQELQNIKKEFISVAIYTAQINKFEVEIEKLRKQIENITQPTTLSEEGKDKSAAETTKQKIHDGNPNDPKESAVQIDETAISGKSGEDNTTTEDSASSDRGNPAADGVLPKQVAQTNQITPSTGTTTPIDFGVNDPDVSTLETAILKEIRNSKAYTSINNINRGRLLKQANTIKSENKSVSDNALHMQVILALYFLQNKPSTVSLNETTDLYKDCYNGELPKITKLQAIVDTFLGIEKLTVTVATFQEAINNDNFKTIMINGAIGDGNYKKSVINKIKPENKGS